MTDPRGADTRVCRVETHLDAFSWSAGVSLGMESCRRRNPFWEVLGAGNCVPMSRDAADTSVRATFILYEPI
jgi:hypothetical protein